MCGRYPSPGKVELNEKVSRQLHIENIPDGNNYNTAPTASAPVTISDHPNKIIPLRWGFDYLQGPTKAVRQFINARAETLDETKTFKGLIRNNRCIVYSKGFYEWDHKSGGDPKQPFLFMVNRGLTVYAGLWQNRMNMKTKLLEPCFVIITCEPNNTVGAFHDRMPVILNEQQQKLWLSNDLKQEELLSLLRPYPDEDMHVYPVTKSVNSIRNNSPDFMIPIDPNGGQQSLF